MDFAILKLRKKTTFYHSSIIVLKIIDRQKELNLFVFIIWLIYKKRK